MPAVEVNRLHDAVLTAFATPEVREAMAKQDNIINPTTPDAAARYFKTEQDRYARLVKKANVSLD
jgi:tripartite-type tricarboxylate transporter receptor subunit TctC